jgi:hypothetical protein
LREEVAMDAYITDSLSRSFDSSTNELSFVDGIVDDRLNE